MAEIRFDRVSKRFGNLTVLDNLNLTVYDREFLTLVGPSGCGKSTTLNILAGLEDPSEGLISIDGRVVNQTPSGARDIAMVFQSYALYPHMTVRENIGFGLRVRGMSKAEIEQRVNEAAKILDIANLLDRRPRELSGGQRQRVALGRAITRRPKAFLLDEPLSNLDAQLRTQMRAELKILFERLSGTVVYVTHDQAEAMTMSDRLAIMRNGCVQQIGTPIEVYHNPATMFVASFIGSPGMNFITGELQQSEGRLTLSTPGVYWPIHESLIPLAQQSRHSRIVLGVRPEHIKIGRSPNPDSIPALVEVLEPLGAQNLVYLRVGDERIVVTTEPDFMVRSGEAVGLYLDNGRVHLFDAVSEHNLRGGAL